MHGCKITKKVGTDKEKWRKKDREQKNSTQFNTVYNIEWLHKTQAATNGAVPSSLPTVFVLLSYSARFRFAFESAGRGRPCASPYAGTAFFARTYRLMAVRAGTGPAPTFGGACGAAVGLDLLFSSSRLNNS
jgi:hypothetical protein